MATDVPRWVEARGLLLSGRGRVVAGEELSSGWVVQSDDDHLSVVVAWPSEAELRAALPQLPTHWTVLAHADAAEPLLRVVGAWQMEPATVFAHPNGMLPPRETTPADPDVIAIDPTDDRLMQHVPRALRAQLERAATYSAVLAVSVHERPVSFAYAAFETEALFDVSVDTLPEFRGRGFGAIAVHALAALMRRQFKRPVWGSLDSNTTSLALARTLGFEPVDRLIAFSRG